MTQIIQCVSYGRNSSDQQLTSQDIQRDEFSIFAAQISKQIFGNNTETEIIHDYADHGVSGSKQSQFSKRTDFNRLLSDIESGIIEATGQAFPKFVVVLNTSRFSRLHHADTMALHHTLYKNGVKLVSIEDRKIFDIKKFDDFLSIVIKAKQDNDYSRSLGHNILRGLKHATELGKSTISNPPYGMQRVIVDTLGRENKISRQTKYRCGRDEDSYLIPGDDTEQTIVRYIFTEFSTSDISYNALARKLNHHDDERYRMGPLGSGWRQQTIQGLLRNHHLAGWEYIGKKRTGGHATLDNGIVTARDMAVNPPEPILVDVAPEHIGHRWQGCVVDRELFNTAQLKQDSRQRLKRRCNGDYPLSGILTCQCGGPLYANQDHNYSIVRYGCKRPRQQIMGDTCGYWSVKQDEVLPAILQLVDGEVWKQQHEPEPKQQQLPQDNTKQLDSINRKIEQIRERIKTSDDETVSILMDALTDATTKRRQLIEQQATIRKPNNDLVDKWHEFVEPLLVKVPTTKTDQTYKRIRSLFPDWTATQIRQLADEGDRLFNVVSVPPSKIRHILSEAGISVQFSFAASDPLTDAKKRRLWRIESAKVTMGTDQTDLEFDKPCSRGGDERFSIVKKRDFAAPVHRNGYPPLGPDGRRAMSTRTANSTIPDPIKNINLLLLFSRAGSEIPNEVRRNRSSAMSRRSNKVTLLVIVRSGTGLDEVKYSIFR